MRTGVAAPEKGQVERMRAPRTPLLLALVAGALIAPAAAQAGETHFISTSGKGDAVVNGQVVGGYARANITVDFKKRSYDVKGILEDVCSTDGKGDGRGAYVGANFALSPLIAKDSNGCGNGRVNFDPPATVSKNLVYGVTLYVCERDYSPYAATAVCSSYYFDNPYLTTPPRQPGAGSPQ